MEHFKKIIRLAILLPIIALTGCEEEQVDWVLVNNIWKAALKETNLPAEAPMPEISFLNEDFYAELLKKDCGRFEGRKYERCREKVAEIKEKLKLSLGRTYDELYYGYVENEQQIINEDCSQYEEDSEKKECRRDKQKLRGDYNWKVLGRAYFGKNRVEIYIPEIEDTIQSWDAYYRRNYSSFNYDEQRCYFYNTIAHELMHIALFKKGYLANDHHRVMKEPGAFINVLDFISRHFETSAEGVHKKLAIRSLERGMEGDEIENRIMQRQRKAEDKKNKNTKGCL